MVTEPPGAAVGARRATLTRWPRRTPSRTLSAAWRAIDVAARVPAERWSPTACALGRCCTRSRSAFVCSRRIRMRSAPHPTAYTVELVDPSALGGKLLAGPIGGGAASRRAPAAPRAPSRRLRRRSPRRLSRRRAATPRAGGEAAEPERSPRRTPPAARAAEAGTTDAVPLATATPPPQPTARVQPTARPSATVRAAAKPAPNATATPKPTASPVARAGGQADAKPPRCARTRSRRRVRSPSPAAARRRRCRRPRAANAGDDARAEPGGASARRRPDDLDGQLAAAIKGVEQACRARRDSAGGGGARSRRRHGRHRAHARRSRGRRRRGSGRRRQRPRPRVRRVLQSDAEPHQRALDVGRRRAPTCASRCASASSPSGEITNIRLVERSGDPEL